jgi:hypothetical protein
MSARTRKSRKDKSTTARFASVRSWLTRRRLVVLAGGCVLLVLVGLGLWHRTPTENVEITADQLDRDFNSIGLGPLGVPESARISQIDGSAETVTDSAHDHWQADSHIGDVEHAVAANSALEGQPGTSRVMFPESAGADGPLFPDPLSVPVGRIDGPVIQPTQFRVPATPSPVAPSGPAWLTGGIEFTDEPAR